MLGSMLRGKHDIVERGGISAYEKQDSTVLT